MITTKFGERTLGTGLLGRASEQAQLLGLYIPHPWTLKGVEVVDSWPLR